jgi:hypothetical protein
MKAYVELIQRKEREIGCDVLTHQKVCPLLPPAGCGIDNLVVRCRLRRFNDDDRYRWNVSSSAFTRSSTADVTDRPLRPWAKE